MTDFLGNLQNAMAGREAGARVGHERTDADFDNPWLVQKQHPAAKAVIFVAALFAAACVALHTATFFVVPSIPVFVLSIAVCASASALVINLAEWRGVLRTVGREENTPWYLRFLLLPVVLGTMFISAERKFAIFFPDFSHDDVREIGIAFVHSSHLLMLTAIAATTFLTFFCGIRGYLPGWERVVAARCIGKSVLLVVAFSSLGYTIYAAPFANEGYWWTSVALTAGIAFMSLIKRVRK